MDQNTFQVLRASSPCRLASEARGGPLAQYIRTWPEGAQSVLRFVSLPRYLNIQNIQNIQNIKNIQNMQNMQNSNILKVYTNSKTQMNARK